MFAALRPSTRLYKKRWYVRYITLLLTDPRDKIARFQSARPVISQRKDADLGKVTEKRGLLFLIKIFG